MNTSFYSNPCYTSKELSKKKQFPVLATKQPVAVNNWYNGKQYQR